MRETGRTAILFPGQGSSGEGMRESVERRRPHLLELAADAFEHFGEGTRYDQPVIFCASLAGFDELDSSPADFHAGHSLGEIAALVAAGALQDTDALRIVLERGRLMQEAAGAAPGGMLAVRASLRDGETLAERSGAALANHNSPEQVVLSGTEAELRAAEGLAAELGVRSKRLPVAGAFHSPLMEPARVSFRAVVDEIEFGPADVPVISCLTARPVLDPRRSLADALVQPVRWVDVLHVLDDVGVRRFPETGPGRVLTGLVRRTLGQTAEPAHV